MSKIGKLEQHCGDCGVIEYCGESYYYTLCTDDRFKDVDEERYKELAEKIDWSDFQKHLPCQNCEKDCDECEERAEDDDVLVRFIADKVSELLKIK